MTTAKPFTIPKRLTRTFPGVPWCRYADAGLIHCETEAQAFAMRAALADRLAACGLAIHPEKTHVVYCKDGSRKERHPNTKFDFLGYCFRPRVVKNRKRNSLFVSFTPAVSAKALKAMRATTRRLSYRNRTGLSLRDISRLHNPVAGLGGLLWEVRPVGAVSGLQALQQNVGGLGDAEVQTTEAAQDAGKLASRKHSREAAASVRTLAARDGGRVCLMGAV